MQCNEKRQECNVDQRDGHNSTSFGTMLAGKGCPPNTKRLKMESETDANGPLAAFKSGTGTAYSAHTTHAPPLSSYVEYK